LLDQQRAVVRAESDPRFGVLSIALRTIPHLWNFITRLDELEVTEEISDLDRGVFV